MNYEYHNMNYEPQNMRGVYTEIYRSEPKSTKSATQILQNKPNLLNAQMNVTSVLTKDYENKRLCGRGQNKPNQTQLNPIKPNRSQFQTQSNPICSELVEPVSNLFYHNGLDNRKANLREATAMQNTWNRKKMRGNFSSRFKGVSWISRFRKWRAKISFGGKTIHLGYFKDEEAAARTYDAKAVQLYGEFAKRNFPE